MQHFRYKTLFLVKKLGVFWYQSLTNFTKAKLWIHNVKSTRECQEMCHLTCHLKEFEGNEMERRIWSHNYTMVFLFQCACNSSYLLGSSSALFYIIHNFIQLKIILHHITDVYNSVSNRLQPKQNCFNLNWETPRFSSQYMYTIDCRLHISQVLVVLPFFYIQDQRNDAYSLFTVFRDWLQRSWVQNT
jgi:hypothetical protein